MGSTFHSLRYHIVFSTKDRRPLIRKEWRSHLHEYLGGIVRSLGGVAETVGGVEDHVHLLVTVGTMQRVADLVRELKKGSSIWAAENHDRLFSWQDGYAVFSVSWTHANTLKEYIATQEEHHRKHSFTDELKRLLERNGVTYDAKYLG